MFTIFERILLVFLALGVIYAAMLGFILCWWLSTVLYK